MANETEVDTGEGVASIGAANPSPVVSVAGNGRIFGAEFVGTFILMLGGPGTAVLATGDGGVGVLGVSLGFGLALMVAVYAVGPVSGCHINPAVTLGMAVMRKIDSALIPLYWMAQLMGATFGGLVILLLARGELGGFDADVSNFAVNLWGVENGFYTFGSMMIAEVVLTAVLMFVVLSTTNQGFPPAAGGLAIGFTLTLIHLISIPIDNTSVNPARSFGMAVFTGGEAVTQLWAFFVFPMVGAVLGVLAWLMVDDDTVEDTMLVDTPLDEIRDAITDAVD